VAAAAAVGIGNAVSEMSNADEEAGTKPATGAIDEVCSTCPPPPESECGKLYAKIKELTQELAKRRADMLADRSVSQGGLGMYETFLKDPYAKIPHPRGIEKDLGNWDGHRRQILEKQENMNRNLKKYRDKKCGVLPPGAETQAGLPPPSRPFN
uniref:hypothetical protein n=1 Tax=Rhizobium sp. FKY42 TaxID=2562310 RepID=UPI0014851C39